MTEKNAATRSMLNTINPAAITITHRAKISHKYKTFLKIVGICNPCSCIFCHADEIYDSTYVQVQENRIEWNYPGFNLHVCCCGTIEDNIGVVYFDKKRAKHAGKAGFCSPCCTHQQPFPTCCDLFGEAAVFYGNTCCCFNKWVMLGCLENAESLVAAFHAQKQARMAGQPPSALTMTP